MGNRQSQNIESKDNCPLSMQIDNWSRICRSCCERYVIWKFIVLPQCDLDNMEIIEIESNGPHGPAESEIPTNIKDCMNNVEKDLNKYYPDLYWNIDYVPLADGGGEIRGVALFCDKCHQKYNHYFYDEEGVYKSLIPSKLDIEYQQAMFVQNYYNYI